MIPCTLKRIDITATAKEAGSTVIYFPEVKNCIYLSLVASEIPNLPGALILDPHGNFLVVELNEIKAQIQNNSNILTPKTRF